MRGQTEFKTLSISAMTPIFGGSPQPAVLKSTRHSGSGRSYANQIILHMVFYTGHHLESQWQYHSSLMGYDGNTLHSIISPNSSSLPIN